jgi:hypothetical protein
MLTTILTLNSELHPRRAIRLAFWLVLFAGAARGEDIVQLSPPGNRQARSRISGEVIEYTGKQVVVKLPDGREIKRPGAQVVAIETTWPSEKTAGDRLFDDHQFSTAREKYAAALRAEARPWARRAILARIIACYRELNQFDAAAKLFLALVREDPDTPYFDQIPLAWMPLESSAALVQIGNEWLADEGAVPRLVGASFLLTSLERKKALDCLSDLSLEKDKRISCLAEAQAWRANIPTASQDTLSAWERRVEAFPEALRAGPYWVLGRALAQHGEADRALLAYLHVPIVYPQARALAADSLRAAALVLDKQGEKAGALRLRQELLANYPETAAAAESQAMLDKVPMSATTTMSVESGRVEETFLAGLRARRLFSLAERHCNQQLGETGLSEPTRIDFAVELARTLSEHALHEDRAGRNTLWQQAVEAVRAPGLDAVKGSRRLLLEGQQALVHLTHGEVARQEVELAGSHDGFYEVPRGELRAAVSQLQTTLKEVSRELRQASPTQRAGDDDLSSGELTALERNLQYQLARAFRNQGESYPEKSPDRANSLRQAVELLQPLTSADQDATAWSARLDEIVCLRLLEDFDAAGEKIHKTTQMNPPSAMTLAVHAEEIRLLLDLDQLDEALAVVEKLQAAGTKTADLDYACLEAYVAAWRRASEGNLTADASQWQDRAAALIQEIDDRFGRYWSRRAEMLLAGTVTRAEGTQNLAVLVRAAESFYRSGEFDQSLAAYDRATRQARESGQPQSFEYAYTAGAIEQQRGHYIEAAKRFRAVALGDATNAKAPDAHLLAIYNTALAKKDDEGAVSKKAYLDLLKEHLDHWPRSSTVNQVRVWLGAFYEREQHWSEAIEAYKAISADDRQAATGVEAAARCYEKWLASLTAANEPTGEIVSSAGAYFERLVTGGRTNLPEHWSQTQRIAATSAAAIWLQYADGEFARADRLLSATLADTADAPDEWKSTAQTLRVFALAAQGRHDEAARLLDELSGDAPRQMLVLVEGLQRSAAKAPPNVKRELAKLQLVAARRVQVRASDLPADQQRDFQRAYVQALDAAGKHSEALAAAKQLAEASPRDGELQEQHARLLVDSDDRASLKSAAVKWHEISRKTRQGSDRWLRAMYYQAAAQQRLGHQDQTLRIVKYTEGLVPELGGAEMKAKFQELLKGH